MWLVFERLRRLARIASAPRVGKGVANPEFKSATVAQAIRLMRLGHPK